MGVQNGETLRATDGPFPEMKETLGGYYLFEGDDLDAAIELAARSRLPASAVRSRCVRWRRCGRSSPGPGSCATSGGGCSRPLVGFLGDFDLAEEATQDAFAGCPPSEWPRESIRPNPYGGWLVITARNQSRRPAPA